MAAIVLRPGRSSDARAVYRLEEDAFPNPWSATSLARDLAGGDRLSLVAERATQPTEIVAYVLLRCLGTDAELLRIAVHPDCRRRGLGTRLIRRTSEQLAARGIDRCLLEVRADNRAAIRLYGRFSAREIGRRPAYYRDGSDALILAFATTPIARKPL